MKRNNVHAISGRADDLAAEAVQILNAPWIINVAAGMRLRITTPVTVVVDEVAVQIVAAEDASGAFAIKPRHADFLTSLAVGVVSWQDRRGVRRYCAVHGGLLTVTGGAEVAITTREAIPGDDLATLDQAILSRFGAEADAGSASRVDRTASQPQAIRKIVRRLRPGVVA